MNLRKIDLLYKDQVNESNSNEEITQLAEDTNNLMDLTTNTITVGNIKN